MRQQVAQRRREAFLGGPPPANTISMAKRTICSSETDPLTVVVASVEMRSLPGVSRRVAISATQAGIEPSRAVYWRPPPPVAREIERPG